MPGPGDGADLGYPEDPPGAWAALDVAVRRPCVRALLLTGVLARGKRKPPESLRFRGKLRAEDGGFEPPRACTQHAFQACAIGH